MELSVTQSHSLHTGAPDITNAPIVAHLEAAHTIVAGSAIITRQKIILKMEIWVACTRIMVTPGLLLRTMGLWSCYSWGLCWCPLSVWTQGTLWSTKCVEVWGHAEPTPLLSHWPWESWSCPSKESCDALGKLVPSLTMDMGELAMSLVRKGCSQLPRMTNSASTQAHTQTSELSLPSIYPIYDMVETMKRLVLQYHNHMISMTQDTAGNSERGFGEESVLWYTRSLEPN